MPLGFEWAASTRISPSSLHLVASMYGMSIGTSSKDPLGFGIGVVVAIVFAAFFGFSMGEYPMNHASILDGWRLPLIAIGLVFLIHAGERYNRHVADLAPFWEFSNVGDE
jgi:hypothetical protein